MVAVAPRASQPGHRFVLLRLVCAGLCVLQLGVGRAPGRVDPCSNVWLAGSHHRCLGRTAGQPGAARVAGSARGVFLAHVGALHGCGSYVFKCWGQLTARWHLWLRRISGWFWGFVLLCFSVAQTVVNIFALSYSRAPRSMAFSSYTFCFLAVSGS